MMTHPEARPPYLGRKQLKLLEQFREASRFEPAHGLRPWPDMLPLIRRNMLRVFLREEMTWRIEKDRWAEKKDGFPSYQIALWAELTEYGSAALNAQKVNK